MCDDGRVLLDHVASYRILSTRDPRFDGTMVAAVTSTGIYCRPSCPARTPKPENVRFYSTAAAAQAAGFRACKRCRPDASPGSPQWDIRADVVARAMRLISDGVVDREGVAGLAARLGYSSRHLTRLLTVELGAGPLAVARAQRASVARLLIETTTLPFADIAFAAGFSSIRQFNDTIREIFAATPSAMRQRRSPVGGSGELSLRLPYRRPMEAAHVLDFLGQRAVPGVESYDGETFRRSLSLPYGAAVISLRPATDYIRCELVLDDLRDLQAAVHRARRLLDLDADPVAIDGHLSRDAALAAFVDKHPGTRVPGTVDGAELAVRAVLGQQVSVAGARTLAGRLATRYGRPLTTAGPATGGITHLFPSADALAGASMDSLRMPAARARCLLGLAAALASGQVAIDIGADRATVVSDLEALPGIGPWTSGYIAMRALRDPDVFLATDLGVLRGAAAAGLPAQAPTLAAASDAWRPWRSYAVLLLWSVPSYPREKP